MKRLNLILVAMVLLISGCAIIEMQVVEQSTAPSSATEHITTSITDTAQTPEDIIQSDTAIRHGIISEYRPIVIKAPGSDIGILLGGFNQKWLTEDEASAYIQGKEEYKLLSLTDYLGIGIGNEIITDYTPIPYTIDIQSSLSENDGFLAISCDWNPIPRIPIQQSNSSEVYSNIVSKILEENGLNDVPVNIVQNYKIDIEGDGQDEVLLCAQNIETTGLGATYIKNTYTLVVLRKIVNGNIENIFLTKAIYKNDGVFGDGCPYVNNIETIADLDGDGEMEVVVGFIYYEGYGYEIYDLVKNQFDLALQTICGGQ